MFNQDLLVDGEAGCCLMVNGRFLMLYNWDGGVNDVSLRAAALSLCNLGNINLMVRQKAKYQGNPHWIRSHECASNDATLSSS